MNRMKFGIFHAPFHDHATNPNANLHRDLELIRHLDYLGFDEAWIGEHHSCGTEIIADPLIFCATALGADPEHQARYRCAVGAVSQPAVGRRPHHPARSSEPRSFHVRRRAGRTADRCPHDRDPPVGATAHAGGGHGRHHAPALRGRSVDDEDRLVRPGGREVSAPAVLHRSGDRGRGHRFAVRSPHRRAPRHRPVVDRRDPADRCRHVGPPLRRVEGHGGRTRARPPAATSGDWSV